MKARRFFYHFNKFTKRLTVHYKNQCIPVDDIICNVTTESKWNKTQPMLVIQGMAMEVQFFQSETGLTAIIN